MNAEWSLRGATAFAENLAASCTDALGDRLIAVILHGSLTLDDFRPGRSDIDLLVVVDRLLTDGEIGALKSAVKSIAQEAPCRVDLRVVTLEVAANPTPAPAMEAYFELRPGLPANVETRVQGEPDLTIEFSMVRQHGRSMIGPDPTTMVGMVPPEWVVEIGEKQLAAWEYLTDDARHAELMVLTTCRIWRFSAEGVHCSKSEAGRWALARDPTLTAVEEALRQRAGERNSAISEEGIRQLLFLVRREIASRGDKYLGGVQFGSPPPLDHSHK